AAVEPRFERADSRDGPFRTDARGPRHHRARCDPGCALRLSEPADRASDRGAGGRELAHMVDLLGRWNVVGIDSAGDHIHLLVLAGQGGDRRADRVGEAAVSQRREATPASVPAVRRGDALDVSMLPTYGFGYRSLMWWGTAGMIVIEGVAFGFMIIVYFYLRSLASTWPMGGAAPDLLWGTVNMGIFILSALHILLTDKASINHDRRKVRIGLVICSLFGVALCAVRWLEFTALNARSDESAHGSGAGVRVGLPTFTLVTDVGDTLVLTALM